MKYLINQNFKVIRKGDYVTASSSAQEFIFDTDNCDDLTVATLLEIASANKAKISKDKKETVIEKLHQHLETLEIPIMSQKPESEIVKEIVAAGVEANKSDDDMLIEIVQAGIKFKAAGKLFAQAMQEGGYRITAKARKDKCREILVDEEFNPKSYDELQAMIERLTQEVDDTVTSQAYSCVKAYAREFEIELPKAPKKPKGGIRAQAQNWMLNNPEATKDDLAEWIESEAKKDDPEGKMLDRMWSLFEFGKAMRATA